MGSFEPFKKQNVVIHTYHPNTQIAGAGGLGVQSQPELQNETLSQKKKFKNFKKKPKTSLLHTLVEVTVMSLFLKICNFLITF
jgi:hypothetical protein